MEIRQLSTTDEFEECRAIQRKAWKFSDDDILPFHLIRAFCDTTEPYGIMLGAFNEKIMIGFCTGFPTLTTGSILMHMIAVSPEYHNMGIGALLMNELVVRAREKNLNKIVWTYDPLESANASLYFQKMKSICRKYAQNYYVFKKSNLSDIPADRFKMELNINTIDCHPIDSKDVIRVEIPGNFQEIKEKDISLAIEHRVRTRGFFQRYINQNNSLLSKIIQN